MFSIEITTGFEGSYLYAELKDAEWIVRIRKNHKSKSGVEDNNGMLRVVSEYLEKPYERLTMYLEDNIVVVPEPGKIVSFDALTGKIAQADVSPEQIRAICLLGLGGDEIPLADVLYKIAEPVVSAWPTQCRSIP